MSLISVIIPCYNEEASLPLFYSRITNVMKTMGAIFELVFINDGSSDGTQRVIEYLSEKDSRVKYISFSRNFGKEAALWAGLEHAMGDYVALIDADLQDPPELLKQMYKAVTKEGFDCAAARRVSRIGEPPIRSFFARQFYRLINRISKTQIVDGAREFRLMTRQVADAILQLKEINRFSKGIFSWVGFCTKWIEYENVLRSAGETKWSFWKLFIYSLDGIAAFSTAPLALASVMGLFFCFVALIMIVMIIAKTLLWGDIVAGYASTICLILFIGGLELFCVGILGLYLSKTYLETKQRPVYIVKKAKLD